MADLTLPYPGYNWQLTQHMGMVDSASLSALLEAADLFKGAPDFSQCVSSYMANLSMFSENIRSDSGHSDTWRDYQQILSELGLIVSTTLTSTLNLNITPAGLLFLDGEMSYSEMMATQALRYQYPNGYKGIPNQAKAYAQARGINKRWMLDKTHGVRIKPAVLIIRTLLALYEENPTNAVLTAAECATALVPVKNHDNPLLGYENLKYIRANGVLTHDQVLRRSCAEWFSLLLQTGLAIGGRQELRLSQYAIENLFQIDDICSIHETNQDEYRFPKGQESDSFDWFVYYGSPDTSTMSQHVEILSPIQGDGFTIDHTEIISGTTSGDLRLVDFSTPPSSPSFNPNINERHYSPDAIRLGIQRRTKAGRRHEELVGIARQRMIEADFKVFKSDAVDLLGIRDDKCLIVEAKTITKKNLVSQTRKGLMQLGEYRYRYLTEAEGHQKPETLLLLSSKTSYEQWRIGFMESIDIGCANINPDNTFSSCVSREIANSIFQYAS